jgi:hypothetical protein
VIRARALAVVVALVGVGLATPSSASTYYDYWGYWHKPPGATTWQYSKVGPSGYYLQAGTLVEGWRFATGTASPSDPKPRPTDVTYDDYCAGHDADATYRVLLVVDYGTHSGAPSGPVYSCFGSDTQPNGRDVLAATAHKVRDGSDGLICAIDDYPKTGCGEVVSSPAPKPTQTATTTATKPPASHPPTTTTANTSTGGGSTTTSTAPDATSSAGAVATASRQPTSKTPAADSSASAAPSPADSTAVVAKQFVPPRRASGGVPFGFIAACVFVVALVGAVGWQQWHRRRRAG